MHNLQPEWVRQLTVGRIRSFAASAPLGSHIGSPSRAARPRPATRAGINRASSVAQSMHRREDRCAPQASSNGAAQVRRGGISAPQQSPLYRRLRAIHAGRRQPMPHLSNSPVHRPVLGRVVGVPLETYLRGGDRSLPCLALTWPEWMGPSRRLLTTPRKTPLLGHAPWPRWA